MTCVFCLTVVDGGDPSECDVTEWDRGQQDVDDIETLDQLGWELASNTTSRVPGSLPSVFTWYRSQVVHLPCLCAIGPR